MTEPKKVVRGRLSFPSLFKPTGFDGGKETYSTVLLIDPDSPELAYMRRLATQAAREFWGDKIPPNMRSPFRDGTTEKPHLDGYADKIFVRFASPNKPNVVRYRPGTTVLEELTETSVDRDGRLIVYPGVNAVVSWSVYAYDKSGNKGVAFGLGNALILGGGDSFSSSSRPEDDFAGIEPPADSLAGAGDMFD